MFVNLINHSNYSLIISSIKIDDIISFSLRENNKYAALVDIGNLYGTIEFYNKAIKNNLIPIIGVQITYNNAKYVLIAKNIDGLKNINNIVSYLSTNPPSLNIANYLLHVYVIAINDNINID
jgi:DNA polymerase-3 subunit alpha